VTDGVDRIREGMKVEVAPPPGQQAAPAERDATKQRRQGKQGSSGQQVGK